MNAKKSWSVSQDELVLHHWDSKIIESNFASRDAAILFAKDLFNRLGKSGNAEFFGTWWVVCEWDGDECETVYETERCQ